MNTQAPSFLESVIPPAKRHAVHIGIDEQPFVKQSETSSVQTLHIDLMQNLVVVRARLKPGHLEPTHYHAGAVFAVTEQGSWHYLESPEYVNRPGSYLFEPPGSVHTLTVPEDQTEDAVVWFAVYGSLLYMDDKGRVISVGDAQMALDNHKARLAAAGLTKDKVIISGE